MAARLYVLDAQDESNPDFVAEMVQLYFQDSESKINKLQHHLQDATVDFQAVDQLVHQFKGSSASFGAHTMAAVCVRLREAGHAQDAATCRQLASELGHSFTALQERLGQFMELETTRKSLAGNI